MGLTDPSISLLGRSSLLEAPHRVSDRLSMTACGASQTSRDQVAVTSRDYSRQTSLEAGDFGVVAGAPTRGRQWSRARRPATVSPPAPSIQAARHYAPCIQLFRGAIFWTEHFGQKTAARASRAPPALGKGRHRRLARGLVPVRRALNRVTVRTHP